MLICEDVALSRGGVIAVALRVEIIPALLSEVPSALIQVVMISTSKIE